jgi:hypothetical protein
MVEPAMPPSTPAEPTGLRVSPPDLAGRGEPSFRIATPHLEAEVRVRGYVSGVAGGTLLDRATGTRDLGHGLDVVDFLLEPGSDAGDPALPAGQRYHWGDLVHGAVPKRYVELPQICTRAALEHPLEHEALVDPAGRWAALRLRYRYREAARGRRPGSCWEQTLVFPAGTRYFLGADRVTSANDVEALILRTALPGHVRLDRGHGLAAVYLSYVAGAGPVGPGGEGSVIAGAAFRPEAPFPPDARYFYRRLGAPGAPGRGRAGPPPRRMIRAYQVRLPDGRPGPWLAGMTLAPDAVYEGWCHVRAAPAGARPYLCLIQEIGGRPGRRGAAFGAAYVIGWFDTLEAAAAVYDRYRGTTALDAGPGGWSLRRRAAVAAETEPHRAPPAAPAVLGAELGRHGQRLVAGVATGGLEDPAAWPAAGRQVLEAARPPGAQGRRRPCAAGSPLGRTRPRRSGPGPGRLVAQVAQRHQGQRGRHDLPLGVDRAAAVQAAVAQLAAQGMGGPPFGAAATGDGVDVRVEDQRPPASARRAELDHEVRTRLGRAARGSPASTKPGVARKASSGSGTSRAGRPSARTRSAGVRGDCAGRRSWHGGASLRDSQAG